jgi:hypothetical protein
MNRRNLFTALGIALSLFVAGGGWILTGTLIDRESDALLSATVITPLDVSAATPPTSTPPIEQPNAVDVTNIMNPLVERPRLSESEINSILRLWSATDKERLHEPFKGQLSMEEAIEAGKVGLASLVDVGVLPAKLLESTFERPHAFLAQRQFESLDTLTVPAALDPSYSYWTVTLTNEDMGALLTINAVTGQIWKVDINVYSTNIYFGALDAERILEAFASYLGMESTEKIWPSYKDDYALASMSLAKSMLTLDVAMSVTRTDIGIALSNITVALNASDLPASPYSSRVTS